MEWNNAVTTAWTTADLVDHWEEHDELSNEIVTAWERSKRLSLSLVKASHIIVNKVQWSPKAEKQ